MHERFNPSPTSSTDEGPVGRVGAVLRVRGEVPMLRDSGEGATESKRSISNGVRRNLARLGDATLS